MKKINLLILVAIIFTFSYCTEQNLFEQEENVNLQQDDTLTELNKVNVREVDIEEARQELEIFREKLQTTCRRRLQRPFRYELPNLLLLQPPKANNRL